MKIKSCGIIPFIREDNTIKFLLIRHQSGHWAFPKGTKESGESDLETAKREFTEETGIKDFRVLNEDPLMERYSFILPREKEKEDKEVILFLAEVTDEKTEIQQKEIVEYSWVKYENALKIITHEGTAQCLKKAYNLLLR